MSLHPQDTLTHALPNHPRMPCTCTPFRVVPPAAYWAPSLGARPGCVPSVLCILYRLCFRL